MRLLVIEDEPRIAEILKTALERAEFVVDTVRSRSDAREALANTAYDAAILDLGLPDGDGLNLFAELRPTGYRIPILILIARDTVKDRVCGLDAGADDYLVKPFAIDELVARTKALLRRPGGALGVELQARQPRLRYNRQRCESCRHHPKSPSSRMRHFGASPATPGARRA